jgi:hypothetical protein
MLRCSLLIAQNVEWDLIDLLERNYNKLRYMRILKQGTKNFAIPLKFNFYIDLFVFAITVFRTPVYDEISICSLNVNMVDSFFRAPLEARGPYFAHRNSK